MNNKLAYSTLLILIIISSVVYSQEEVNPKIEPKCIASTSNADFENKFLEKYNADPKGICNTDLAKAEKLGLLKGKDLGTFNPQEIQELGKKLGQDWSDIASFNGATLNEDGTLSRGTLTTKEGNTISNPEIYKKENNNIIADSLEFTAISSPAEFSVMNPIDSTKIKFNIPKGGSVKLTNKEGIFETITSEGVEEEIISKCPGPLLYTAIEKDSTLTIQKNINSIYSFSYGALEFNANSKKQLLTALGSKSEAEIDPCKGFICFALAPEAKFDNEDKLDTFYLENPDIGKNYKFCLEKNEGDGYKIKDNFNLDGQIKFLNFKKDKVYFGIDQNNEASFTTEQGIIKEFKLKNKAPSQQLIARLWPSKAFELREEKDHSYLTLLNSLPDYTFIENYEPELTSESPAFWIKDDLLYQDNKNGKLGRALTISNQEFAKLIAKLNFKKIKIDEPLKQWE